MPIWNVFVHVTKACNLHCVYCYFSASTPLADEMTTEEFGCLWPMIIGIHPQKVVITGGEPLLRTDLFALLQGLSQADPEHCVRRCLNSNGHLVTPEFARKLVGLVDGVRVSLDGLAERNDALRGRGNFELAMKAVKCYMDAGFDPTVLVTVTSATLPDLEALLALLIENNVTRIKLNEFRPTGRGQGKSEWRVNPEEVRGAVHRAWRRVFPGIPELQSLPHSQCQVHCGVGHFLNIMPNGDVFPCHVLSDPEFRCGNVREQSLADICQNTGLLASFESLNFRDLARQDKSLLALTEADACMAAVYTKTRTQSVWQSSLPLTQRKTGRLRGSA